MLSSGVPVFSIKWIPHSEESLFHCKANFISLPVNDPVSGISHHFYDQSGKGCVEKGLNILVFESYSLKHIWLVFMNSKDLDV